MTKRIALIAVTILSTTPTCAQVVNHQPSNNERSTSALHKNMVAPETVTSTPTLKSTDRLDQTPSIREKNQNDRQQQYGSSSSVPEFSWFKNRKSYIEKVRDATKQTGLEDKSALSIARHNQRNQR